MSMDLGRLAGPPDDAIATLARRAEREGANVGPWPGLTIYRFTGPTAWRWDGTAGLSVGMVVRERRVAAADGTATSTTASCLPPSVRCRARTVPPRRRQTPPDSASC